jgi:hypothetical protein
MVYQIAPDFRSSSRLDIRRIVELCHCCRNAEDGRKDKQDGMSFDRNRLKPDRDAIRLTGLRLPVLVESIVVVDQEHPLTSISALRYMVRHTGDDNPRKSRHPTIINLFEISVNGQVSP